MGLHLSGDGPRLARIASWFRSHHPAVLQRNVMGLVPVGATPLVQKENRSAMSSFTVDDFLADTDAQEIDWVKPSGAPVALSTVRVTIGAGADALEVALATSTGAPKMDDVRRLWALRWNRRAAPVLLVVAYQDATGWEATICGPSEDPAAVAGLDLSQVDRICGAALSAETSTEAKRTLQRLLVGTKDQLIAGLTNQGLFASHELRHGVPTRDDWESARDTGRVLLGKSGPDLIAALGYTTTAHGSVAQVLSTGSTRHAVAVLLNETELFDRPGQRFGAVSPVTQGLALAQEQNLPWLMVLRGTQIRLYPAKPDVGVGRKGQSETFVELDLALLTEADAGYLPMLFSPTALDDSGTVAQILAASVDHATALGARLRDRVYVDVVPALAVAVANAMKADKGADLDEADLHEAYHRTLVILFRLLFVSYAEDRGLLPYQRNPRYTRKALKTMAREFAADTNITFDANADDRWEDLLSVWQAVDDGNREWDVPAYNGGLFAADEGLHPAGYAISQMRLTNAEIGPALKDLLIDRGSDGDLGPVDFRSLSVREFGTIYEGLLESSLSIAPTDLTVDPRTNAYLPAPAGTEPVVRAGDVYFHNASGARKSTGSYFTKAFAVEHLLDTTLEPALVQHLAVVKALLDNGDEAGAAEKFFDFRVADLAMGSGHFLVAAIDRIENRFAKFLAGNPIASVTDELTRLSAAATEALGEAAGYIEIEPSMLLRRQIARRCIYGLDLNLMAVELARLGIWIHTFVPGLPMSSLDHGLRVGNSLTGIGTVEEALAIFEPDSCLGQLSLFGEQIEDALAVARDRLLRVARTAEATKQEVRESARAHAKAMHDAQDARALLDAAVAVRLGVIGLPSGPDEAVLLGRSDLVQDKVAELDSAHMPYLFPEVFMRENPGFDVFLGNPPWEKAHVEEHNFWTIRFPGLKALPEEKMNDRIQDYRRTRPDLVAEYDTEVAASDTLRDVILKSKYPGIGSGHVDLFQVFCWRTWRLLRHGGRAGIVLPRGATSGTGTAKWREEVLNGGSFEDVTFLMNDAWWVFDEVDNRLRCSLTTYAKATVESPTGEVAAGSTERGVVSFRGPYRNMAEYRDRREGQQHAAEQFLGWSGSAVFPMMPSADSQAVFEKLRAHPRIDAKVGDFEFRPVQGDFNATTHKALWTKTPFQGAVKVLAGASYNLWDPDAGAPFGYGDPKVMLPTLREKRVRATRSSRSAYHGLNAKQVQEMPARISFRDRTNLTNSRSTLVALTPPDTVLVHNAPFLVRRRGDEAAEAYMLGVLSSIPFDWYVRRWVDRHLTFDLFNPAPLPRPEADDAYRVRVTAVAGTLAAVDERYTDWAAAVGVPVGSVSDEATKADLLAELDALVSLLYGLDRDDVVHLFETFHRGWNYQPRLDAVLAHYDAWKLKGN